jgi:hypothetical protein
MGTQLWDEQGHTVIIPSVKQDALTRTAVKLAPRNTVGIPHSCGTRTCIHLFYITG